MIPQRTEKTLHQFVKCLSIRHPIVFGKKVMTKTESGPEFLFPTIVDTYKLTNLSKLHLEKVILILLRFLLAGDKTSTIEDDAITALRGIVDDDIIDEHLKTVSNISALNRVSVDAIYRLAGARDGYWPRTRISMAQASDIIKIVEWLYVQINNDAGGEGVWLPVITANTQEMKNIVVTKNTVWSIDIWAKKLRSYSPRQAMAVLSVLVHPVRDHELPFTPALPNPVVAQQPGVLCPYHLSSYQYLKEDHPPGLIRRWSDTFDWYRIGLSIY